MRLELLTPFWTRWETNLNFKTGVSNCHEPLIKVPRAEMKPYLGSFLSLMKISIQFIFETKFFSPVQICRRRPRPNRRESEGGEGALQLVRHVARRPQRCSRRHHLHVGPHHRRWEKYLQVRGVCGYAHEVLRGLCSIRLHKSNKPSIIVLTTARKRGQ